jgi:HSP20 family molecular chaperone IbpA
MDRMIDSLVGELEKVSESDIGSQVTYNDKGDFALRCDTSGFKPEELTVDLDGQTLTVNGKHVEDNEGQSVERHFSRVIRLPKELDQNQIKCELDDKGELSINIPRREQLEAPKQNVPIEMKKNEN